MANYSCKKFFLTTNSLAKVHLLQTTDDNHADNSSINQSIQNFLCPKYYQPLLGPLEKDSSARK